MAPFTLIITLETVFLCSGRKRAAGQPSGRRKEMVSMKLIDEKLKIIDEVPTSAVEMEVKEKVRKI